MQIARHIVGIVILIAVVLYLINQCRKPHGWLGRFFLWEMSGRHSAPTDWGLSHVAIKPADKILDIGCGAGRTIRKLARLAEAGKVFGVDYSAASIAAARKHNRDLIAAGRVELHQSPVSQLPFADESFDLVTAIETHYYWPDLAADLREIVRVLVPGGQLVLIAEAYNRGRMDPNQAAMKLLRGAYLTVAEHRELLTVAGFSEVEILEEHSKGWLCAVGRKPLTK